MTTYEDNAVSRLDPAETDALQRAGDEVAKLGKLLPGTKLALMLSRRYPLTVVQHLFPNWSPPPELVISRPAPSGVVAPNGRGSLAVSAGCLALERLDKISQVGLEPEKSSDAEFAERELGFQYAALIQCTLPHGDPGGATTYTRKNGSLELTVATSVATTGLPYGVPARLLTIFAATEVTRWKSRQIFLGDTITDFLRKLNVQPSSGRRGTVGIYLDQLRRLIHSVFTVVEDIGDGAGRTGLDIGKSLFAENARLWDDGPGSHFVLSQKLFDAMKEHSAPLCMDAVRALRRSPLDLDVYAWLVYRLHTLKRRLVIPWDELSLQFGHDYRRENDFRTAIRGSLKRVLNEYGSARVEPVKAGLCLLPSRPHIVPRRSR